MADGTKMPNGTPLLKARRKSESVLLPVGGHGYEFFGPPGALALSTLLAPICYAFAFLCNDVSGCPVPTVLYPKSFNWDKLKSDVGWHGLATIFNWQAFVATLGWYFLSLVLNTILPAHEAEGTVLRTGGRLKYRFNAFNTALFITVILVAGTFVQGPEFPVWTFIWDNYVPILTSNIIISYSLATFVYLRSFSVKPVNNEMRELAAGGQSGNMLYDWFIGRELNPRVTLPIFGEIDIKAFMELRPGLIGWIVLNGAFIARQYKNYGYITDSIIISSATQAFYVVDALYNEPAILTTIDIIMDGFGFMLSFGDLVWVPFIYSLQPRYLAVHPVQLGNWKFLIAAVFATGYYIFRATNNEKNRFRSNPEDPRIKHLKYIETASGSKLLVSGWWGRARHINYLGDWFMSWAYCMPTGIAGYVVLNNPGAFFADGTKSAMTGQPFAPVVMPGEARGWGMLCTYFFMLYFGVLLVHRERRDEEKCRAKYGKDWERYCEIVPWRIVPYIY